MIINGSKFSGAEAWTFQNDGGMGGGDYWGVQMKQSDLTLVLSSEAFVTMVTLRHEMQPEPVFVADDGCGNIHSA